MNNLRYDSMGIPETQWSKTKFSYELVHRKKPELSYAELVD